MKRLVLPSGGHSHVAVLKSQGEAPMPDARLTLVSAKRYTPCSGMLPGLIAGHYDYHQCHIDLERLAGYARAGLRAHAKKRNGQGDRRLPAALPMREEEEESRETCPAA